MPPKKRRVSDKKPQQPTDPLKVRCLQAIKAARKAGEDLNEASENDTALDGMTKVAADCQRKVITLVQEFAERQSHILDPTARRSSETYEVQMGRLRLLSLIQELKQATTGTKPACIDNMKKVAAKLVENASREFGPQARSSWMPSIKMNEEGQQKIINTKIKMWTRNTPEPPDDAFITREDTQSRLTEYVVVDDNGNFIPDTHQGLQVVSPEQEGQSGRGSQVENEDEREVEESGYFDAPSPNIDKEEEDPESSQWSSDADEEVHVPSNLGDDEDMDEPNDMIPELPQTAVDAASIDDQVQKEAEEREDSSVWCTSCWRSLDSNEFDNLCGGMGECQSCARRFRDSVNTRVCTRCCMRFDIALDYDLEECLDRCNACNVQLGLLDRSYAPRLP